MVDFAMVLLVLLPLVMGILQLALVLHVRNTIASAASEGARFAAVAGSSGPAGEAKVNELLEGTFSLQTPPQVSVQPAEVGGVPGFRAEVTATIPLFGLEWFDAGWSSVTVRATGHAVAEEALAQ